jgi:DNA-binding NtrC family response regulator
VTAQYGIILRVWTFHFDGNRREAAKILGIGGATLYRRLREAQHDDIT